MRCPRWRTFRQRSIAWVSTDHHMGSADVPGLDLADDRDAGRVVEHDPLAAANGSQLRLPVTHSGTVLLSRGNAPARASRFYELPQSLREHGGGVQSAISCLASPGHRHEWHGLRREHRSSNGRQAVQVQFWIAQVGRAASAGERRGVSCLRALRKREKPRRLHTSGLRRRPRLNPLGLHQRWLLTRCFEVVRTSRGEGWRCLILRPRP